VRRGCALVLMTLVQEEGGCEPAAMDEQALQVGGWVGG
jgi:hypothetical protein